MIKGENRIDRGADWLTTHIRIRDIIAITIMMHLLIISFPIDEEVFDEAYYIPAALDILEGEPSNLEHPFLGKAWIALGIGIFGNNFFGWRFITILFSVATIYIVYLIALKFMGRGGALYCATLLAFENMFFIHGSLALIDIPSLFFGTLGIYFFIIKRPWLSATALGLSVLSKETGVLFILVISIYVLSLKLSSKLSEINLKRDVFKTLKFFSLIFIIVSSSVTIYDIIYKPTGYSETTHEVIITEIPTTDGLTNTFTETITHNDAQNITNAIEHLSFMLKYASELTVDDVDDPNEGNYAWNWFLPVLKPYPPLNYYVIHENVTVTSTQPNGDTDTTSFLQKKISWIGVGNMPIWWSTWIVIIFASYLLIKKHNISFNIILLSWIGATYLPMLYASVVVERIVYPFYFLNTIPAITLGIPGILTALINDRPYRIFLMAVFLVTVIFFFLIFFPVNLFYNL